MLRNYFIADLDAYCFKSQNAKGINSIESLI